MDTSTSAASAMSNRWTCGDSDSITSSPASADGPELFEWLASPTTSRSGPDHAPVSPSASPASAKASTTPDICGQSGDASSRSTALTSCLVSRLRGPLTGSPLCEVIWSPWTTPWGFVQPRPRARVRTITGTVIGLWPTATASDHKSRSASEMTLARNSRPLREMVFAMYPTATTPSGGQVNPDGTTMTGKRPDGSKATVTLQNVILAMWSTTTAVEGRRGNLPARPHDTGVPLAQQIAMWTTLRASDGAKGGPTMSFSAGGQPLPSQAFEACRSSNAPTENGAGSLHPEFAGWELGYPPEWLSCAVSATPSTSGRRRRSSKPRSAR